jgi:hypothetical protein
MGRKSKEQVQAERAERERLRMQTRKKEQAERAKLREKQKRERDKQRKAQAARRKKNATTAAGGIRKGAGRPPQDGEKRKTYTFYGTYSEKLCIKQFLKVLREIKQDPEQAKKSYIQIDGWTMLERMGIGKPSS